jgi:hypothetical protein
VILSGKTNASDIIDPKHTCCDNVVTGCCVFFRSVAEYRQNCLLLTELNTVITLFIISCLADRAESSNFAPEKDPLTPFRGNKIVNGK